MNAAKKTTPAKKTRVELLDEALPHFEQFIESRESYIKALEMAIEALRRETHKFNRNNIEIRSSIDELVAMQRLSNSIGTAVEPEEIVSTLIELTKQVIPVIEATIFLFESGTNNLLPLSPRGSPRPYDKTQQQVEAGIVDWVISEKKTVVIPDLPYLGAEGTSRNFVIVPLILRNRAIGIYVVYTGKHQKEFSNQDIQLLSVLANQAAAGIENWRTHNQLVKANEELKASQAQMIQAAKLAAIGELAASIVHEIKNPLQILMMHLEMAERGRAVPNWVELLGKQVKRLSEISKRLMNFSRNVSEECTMVPVNVNKAIEDVLAIVQHDFKSANVKIDLGLCADLPLIVGNANYLQQLFLNLVINARDAMPNGGVLEITSKVNDGQIVARVADTGEGIEQQNLWKIFDAFFTTKELGNGTGLGLSVCSKIVGQHGGQITVDSEVGKGSTFTVTFPIRRKIR